GRGEAAGVRRAGGRQRSHEILEERGAPEQSPHAERDGGPEQRIAPAEAVERCKIEVEGERPPDPCRQGCECLDLTRVLAGDAQNDAAPAGADRRVVYGAAGQLLGALGQGTCAILPAEGRQLVMAAREHGRPQVEATASRQEDLGTLHPHGEHMVPPEGVPPPAASGRVDFAGSPPPYSENPSHAPHRAATPTGTGRTLRSTGTLSEGR